MLTLHTVDDTRLELPASCVLAVMQPSDDSAPSSILYDLGPGLEISKLSDQYGFVKKLVVDSSGIMNPIEIRVVEPVSSEEGQSYGEGKVFFARSRIQARQELKDAEDGAKSLLYIHLFGNVTKFRLLDTLDELDGVETSPRSQ